MSFTIKENLIYEDFTVAGTSLGSGTNGKVLLCVNKYSQERYALKTLRDNPMTRREVELQWRACQTNQRIVKIVVAYANTIQGQMLLVVIMELFVDIFLMTFSLQTSIFKMGSQNGK
jgi:mitogen-activated protein kinase-activated protein kinase 2